MESFEVGTNHTGACWHEVNVLGLTAAGTPATNLSVASKIPERQHQRTDQKEPVIRENALRFISH